MKTKIFRPVLLLAAVLSISLSNGLSAQDLNSATALTRSEQYDEAAAMFKQLIQKEPTNSKYQYFYGENTLAEFFSDTISNSLTVFAQQAKDIYTKGTSANASDPLNYIGLARVAYLLDDDKTASDLREKAKSYLLPYKNIKKMVPPAKDYAFALAKIAESFIRNETVDTALALPYIRQALKIDYKNRDIYLIAGDIYNLVNDGSKAIKNYNLAQDNDPTSSTANMKIGSIYVRGRSYATAIPFYEEAIRLNANYAPAYRELGQVYLTLGRYEQSKTNFEKYLELTKGNIPAQIRYVNALFYAKAYDDVIRQVEEIFKVDKSKTYMNRIAGYSAYEKTPPDYKMALAYMETLFSSLRKESLLPKDYTYLAKILLRKNQDYSKNVDTRNRLNTQLTTAKERYAVATAAAKATQKPNLDTLTAQVARLDTQIAAADKEIDRGFSVYNQALALDPENKVLLSEIATNYYNFRRFEEAADVWLKLVALGKNEVSDYMNIGRAFYTDGKYQRADSIFNVVLAKNPDYVDAYVYIARTYSLMDPETKTGIAKPKFEIVIEKAKSDSVRLASYMMEAFGYLGFYHYQNDNNSRARDYYNRMTNLVPTNNEYKVRGYSGLGQIDLKEFGYEKTNEGRLASLAKTRETYNKILALDANNASAKSMITYLADAEKQVRAGINPNEVTGTIKNAAGQPIPNASVKVKDTAAETLTNVQGKYKFEIPASAAVLIFSASGYQPQEVTITKSRLYNITLTQ